MLKKKSYTSILKKVVTSKIMSEKVFKEISDIGSLALQQKWYSEILKSCQFSENLKLVNISLFPKKMAKI